MTFSQALCLKFCLAPQEIKDHVDAEELKKLGFKAYRPNRQILAIEVDASIAGGWEFFV